MLCNKRKGRLATAMFLIFLLCGCSAKEESAEEAPSLSWEQIENSTESETADTEEPTVEQTPENVLSQNEDDSADSSVSENAAGTLTDDSDIIPTAYRKIIDTVREAMKNREDVALDMETDYIPVEFYQGYSIGYTIQDIDNDGTGELILETESGQQYDDGFIYAMFTLHNGEAVQLFNGGGVRDRYYVCTDGTVKNEGSSGAAYSVWAYYKLADSELVLQECVFTSPARGDETEIGWFYTTTEPFGDFSTEITSEEAAEIIDSYTETELNIIPIEE